MLQKIALLNRKKRGPSVDGAAALVKSALVPVKYSATYMDKVIFQPWRACPCMSDKVWWRSGGCAARKCKAYNKSLFLH